MDNNQEKKSAKEGFANAWKKAAELGKKTVDGAKSFAEQTKQNIHDQQAKKYTPVTAKEYKSKGFDMPKVIEIVDDDANREFVEDKDAIGWIEEHKDVEILHMYVSFVKKSGITFVPVLLEDNVYCADTFDSKKYINANQILGRELEAKLAELRNIAYCLGAKNCSIEIVETEASKDKASVKAGKLGSAESSAKNSNMQSVKTVTEFEGHDDPKMPELKWFAHDDNINGLIKMRLNRAIKNDSLNLSGATSSAMSKKIACAIDSIVKIKGNLSIEKETVREHSKILVFEIEF
ncbi:MAG: hypothetical protein IKJ24_01725 [Clostridia bacterium]|nr:hypothetical protein [Clostridia bacterium]